MKPNDAAIRKRTQIAKANRTMFLWIAIASAIVGVGIVVSIFLFQNLIYNEKVLAEKLNTVATLENNNAVVDDLKDQVRVLDTNTALSSVKANPNDQALQVILDALPAEPNSLALGSSLQNKLLTGIPGLSVEVLQVDPVVGAETTTAASDVVAGTNEITFKLAVRGDQAALRQVLERLEHSIRTIVITSFRIEQNGATAEMTIQGKAFYEPAKSIELQDKKVPR